jgi:hypothetical protein
LAGAGGANDLSDADLLERFRARPEEAAFTLLVQRHGPAEKRPKRRPKRGRDSILNESRPAL